MIPLHVQAELDKLSEAQKNKFQALIAWATSSGIPGVAIPMHTYDHILNMVKQMGEEPVNPIEPDKTVNHDWNFIPVKRENS